MSDADAADDHPMTTDETPTEQESQEPAPSSLETTTNFVAHDWSAFYDDEGRIYYYNAKTDESSWEPPENGKFNPAPEPETEKATVSAEEKNDSQETDPVSKDSNGPKWVLYQDDEGRDYYYNTVTGETQWEAPDDEAVAADEWEKTAERTDDSGNSVKKTSAEQPMDVELLVKTENKNLNETETETTQSQQDEQDLMEDIDPAVRRFKKAEESLALQDSILEPNVMDWVTEVVASQNGNPQNAITALIESYQGQPAVCGLLGRWLADLRATTTTTQQDSTLNKPVFEPLSQVQADGVRQVAEDIVRKIAKEKFTKETGDSILNLSKSEAAFLEDMMDSSRWRRLLIDLSATHKDSALLVYCLRAISKRGHHREIAKRVNHSDHFAVFNAMLLSELSVIGKCAVSAEYDSESSVGLDDLVNDLQRACSFTSYTYLYSVELLKHLIGKAEEKLDLDTPKRFSRAVRKWESIGQLLESSLMDPSASSSEAGSSPLFRKRRLEVALTISNLQQTQRKRSRATEKDDNGAKRTALETALMKFVRRHASGIKIDDSLLNTMLPQGLDLDTASMVGELLIHQPIAIHALLGYIYKPGSNRLVVSSVKNKCARLLAVATIAAEKNAAKEATGNESFDPSDEVALTRSILQGSQLCEQLESMVSFLVTASSDNKDSPGQKLVTLALENAAVAQGVILWARDFTHGHEYAASASFPTLSVSILSLVRIISLQLPFTRKCGVEIAFRFLSHSNSDISYKKMNAIKEQGLRLLLCLMASGEVVQVVGGLTKMLQEQGKSDLDASLIRYVVAAILQIVRTPVSVLFVRTFGMLLTTNKCQDAIRSTYFGEENRRALTRLLTSMKTILGVDGKEIGKCDREFVLSLCYAYQAV
jgi:hypothetical protein